MRSALPTLLAVVTCLLVWPTTGRAALSCGVPEAQPVWIDFTDGSVSFWRDRFARPGIVLATGGVKLAADARAAGAATVHWDMYLRRRVGTPSQPADAGVIERRADALFDYAVSVTDCETPLIALNELWGASLPTPLTSTAELYRENVLRFLSRLAERGGRPALLVSSTPFTGGDAAAWWRSIAAVSDLVLENYTNANVIWREGPIEGSRRLRSKYRSSAARLLAIGVPASRIGIMIGFQTGSGAGGREGLTPRSRWFDVAKWQALAVGEVARELRLAHVWSWGWAQRDERSNDPDKTYAACVWLWSRNPGLCDAPGLLADEFDPDRQIGQLNLPAETRCLYGSMPIRASSVAALARVTHDRELALTALVIRAVETERVPVSPSETLAFERRIVAARFGGSMAAYRSALASSGASLAVGRGIIGDQLRRRQIFARLSVLGPSPREIERFRTTFAPVLARHVVVSPDPSWLPGGEGVALATSAPESVFRVPTGERVTIRTAAGEFEVEALDETTPLGALPYTLARPAIVGELREEKREEAYADWTLRVQKAAQSRLVCDRDRVPEPGVIALSAYAPFLSLDEAEATRWASRRVGWRR